MKAPSVMDLSALQRLPEMVKHADLQKIQSLLNCLPSLPSMPDFHKLKDQLMTPLPSMDFLATLSSSHIGQLLAKCLPEHFSLVNRTDDAFLVISGFLALFICYVGYNYDNLSGSL